jgi:large conductance mechanosensitive channel
MLKEFKAFLMRGNVVDLAVAVVIGAAFGAVVTAFVEGIITPLLGLFGDQDFSQYVITLREPTEENPEGITLKWGDVLTALITFVSVAAAVFFFVVKPMSALQERARRGEVTEDTPAPSDEAVLLTEIRDLLRSQSRS